MTDMTERWVMKGKRAEYLYGKAVNEIAKGNVEVVK